MSEKRYKKAIENMKPSDEQKEKMLERIIEAEKGNFAAETNIKAVPAAKFSFRKMFIPLAVTAAAVFAAVNITSSLRKNENIRSPYAGTSVTEETDDNEITDFTEYETEIPNEVVTETLSLQDTGFAGTYNGENYFTGMEEKYEAVLCKESTDGSTSVTVNDENGNPFCTIANVTQFGDLVAVLGLSDGDVNGNGKICIYLNGHLGEDVLYSFLPDEDEMIYRYSMKDDILYVLCQKLKTEHTGTEETVYQSLSEPVYPIAGEYTVSSYNLNTCELKKSDLNYPVDFNDMGVLESGNIILAGINRNLQKSLCMMVIINPDFTQVGDMNFDVSASAYINGNSVTIVNAKRGEVIAETYWLDEDDNICNTTESRFNTGEITAYKGSKGKYSFMYADDTGTYGYNPETGESEYLNDNSLMEKILVFYDDDIWYAVNTNSFCINICTDSECKNVVTSITQLPKKQYTTYMNNGHLYMMTTGEYQTMQLEYLGNDEPVNALEYIIYDVKLDTGNIETVQFFTCPEFFGNGFCADEEKIVLSSDDEEFIGAGNQYAFGHNGKFMYITDDNE